MKTEGWILKALASVQISLNRETGPGKESSEVHGVTNCLDLFLTDCHVPHCRSFRWVWSNRSRILPLFDSFMFFPHSFIHYYSPPSHWLHLWIASVWSHSFENYLWLCEFFSLFCFLFQYAVTTQSTDTPFLPLFYIYNDIHNYFFDGCVQAQSGWMGRAHTQHFSQSLRKFPEDSSFPLPWQLPATAAGSHHHHDPATTVSYYKDAISCSVSVVCFLYATGNCGQIVQSLFHQNGGLYSSCWFVGFFAIS